MIISFFGHDAGDTTILKRALGFQRAGMTVKGYMMRREEDVSRQWENVDLGQTFDANYLQRLKAVFNGVEICKSHRDDLEKSDIFYARNLDMLICAVLVKKQLNLSVPIIYECLDVHHLTSSHSPLGLAMRWLERELIEKTSLLVFSSPAFEREFFAVHYKGLYRPFLLENRLADDENLPEPLPRENSEEGTLKIGWYGVLRCARSLALLEEIAMRFPDQVRIIMAGKPALTQVPDFYERVEAQENIDYLGPYKAPDDLASLYAKVDVIWAGDFYQAGHNSKWLLPNRIYEGGYYGTPPIAPADCETGAWIDARNAGFTVAEPIEESFPTLAAQLLGEPSLKLQKNEILKSLPRDTFIQEDQVLNTLIETALEGNGKC